MSDFRTAKLFYDPNGGVGEQQPSCLRSPLRIAAGLWRGRLDDQLLPLPWQSRTNVFQSSSMSRESRNDRVESRSTTSGVFCQSICHALRLIQHNVLYLVSIFALSC